MQHQAIAPETIKELTVREFGDAANEAGIKPSDLLRRSEIRLVSSAPEQ